MTTLSTKFNTKFKASILKASIFIAFISSFSVLSAANTQLSPSNVSLNDNESYNVPPPPSFDNENNNIYLLANGWNLMSTKSNLISYSAKDFYDNGVILWAFDNKNRKYYKPETIENGVGHWAYVNKADNGIVRLNENTYKISTNNISSYQDILDIAIPNQWNLMGTPIRIKTQDLLDNGAKAVYTFDSSFNKFNMTEYLLEGAGFWLKK